MRTLTLLVSLGTLWASATPASATVERAIGGPGGRPFELRCPPGSVVLGVNAHAGAWIDGLALLCSTERRNIRQSTAFVGGTSSELQQTYCETNDVRGIQMTFTRGHGLPREYLNAFALICGQGKGQACIDTGEGCYARAKHAGDDDARGDSGRMEADWQQCRQSEALIGIVGRAGDYVDAVGAICGPRLGIVELGSPDAGNRASAEPQWSEPGSSSVSDQLGARSATSALPVSPSSDPKDQLSSGRSQTPSSTSVQSGLKSSLPATPEIPH